MNQARRAGDRGGGVPAAAGRVRVGANWRGAISPAGHPVRCLKPAGLMAPPPVKIIPGNGFRSSRRQTAGVVRERIAGRRLSAD